LATPAVVEAIPLRQAWRAATLGNTPPSPDAPSKCRSSLAGLAMDHPRCIWLDSQ
jgi:hypothetical protein